MLIDTKPIYDDLNGLANDADFQTAVTKVVPGKFVRTASCDLYDARVTYGERLKGYIYNTPVMHAIFASTELKALFFRTFGYRGGLNFTIYANCWIRDLPLLDIGDNVYLGDGIVLGSNQVSVDQSKITVDRIRIGANTIFDQQCMVGYGTRIGADCVVGIRGMIGMRCRIDANVKIGAGSKVGHLTRIGAGASIGDDATIGHFCVVEDGAVVPQYAQIPDGSIVAKDGSVRPRNQARAA